jgi:hypothetical protein
MLKAMYDFQAVYPKVILVLPIKISFLNNFFCLFFRQFHLMKENILLCIRPAPSKEIGGKLLIWKETLDLCPAIMWPDFRWVGILAFVFMAEVLPKKLRKLKGVTCQQNHEFQENDFKSFNFSFWFWCWSFTLDKNSGGCFIQKCFNTILRDKVFIFFDLKGLSRIFRRKFKKLDKKASLFNCGNYSLPI